MIYILLFSIVVFHKWMMYPIVTWSDWMFHYSDSMLEWLMIPQIWSSQTGFGAINITLSIWPFTFLSGLFGIWGYDSSFSDKFIFLLPIVVLTPLTSYFLVLKNTESKIAASVGSIIYTFNTYFLLARTSHLTLMLAFGIAPLVILFFQKTLEQKRSDYALLTGVLAFVVSFYEFRALYILVWVLFLYYLYYQFIVDKQFSFKNILKNASYSAIPVVLVLLLNSYWIIGFSQLGTLTSNEIFNRMLFGNELIDIRNAFTLFHPFWTGARATEFIPQPVPLHFWLVPLFAFLGLIVQRANKNVLFFGFITLLGVLLTKQVSEPFSNLYLWLYNNLPGFNAYREASKFFFLIALGYSVLIAAFVDWMWKKWIKGKVKIYGKYTLTVLIVAIFLWNSKPLLTGEIGGLFVPRIIPNDYKKIEAHLLSEEIFYRTFWIPTYSRWSFYSNTHPQVSAINQLKSSWKFLVLDDFNKGNLSEGELMIEMLQQPETNNLLDNTSIKYVLVPIKDIQNDDDFFRFYGVDRAKYIETLDDLRYLKRVDIGTNEIVVYENEGYKPHLYISKEVETIAEEIEYKQVNYKYENSTKYSITLEDVNQPVYLNFAESYHPQWKVRIGDFSWLKALTQSEYFLPPDIQVRSDANMNSYRVDPKEICAKFECTQKNDGSYNMNVTLFFLPQSYTYLGGIISLSTFVLVLGYLVFTLYGKKK